MTTFAQCQFLRIFDSVGVTWQRWQNYYAHRSITFQDAAWQFQQFDANGLIAGQTGDEGGVTINMPAFPLVVDALNVAMAQGQLLEVLAYQFIPTGNEASPPASQELIARFTGEIVNASATLTTMQVELGSSLSPVGAQIPPRTLTTRLIGKGCRL
jgi:hypothetical protein